MVKSIFALFSVTLLLGVAMSENIKKTDKQIIVPGGTVANPNGLGAPAGVPIAGQAICSTPCLVCIQRCTVLFGSLVVPHPRALISSGGNGVTGFGIGPLGIFGKSAVKKYYIKLYLAIRKYITKGFLGRGLLTFTEIPPPACVSQQCVQCYNTCGGPLLSTVPASVLPAGPAFA